MGRATADSQAVSASVESCAGSLFRCESDGPGAGVGAAPVEEEVGFGNIPGACSQCLGQGMCLGQDPHAREAQGSVFLSVRVDFSFLPV